MAARSANPNFMNGITELLVLRLLESEEMYGYQLVQAILDRIDSVVTAGEGIVYPVLHSLEREGALKSRRRTVNGRSRIYYSITRSGSRRLAELSGTWTTLAAAIQTVLSGATHAQPMG